MLFKTKWSPASNTSIHGYSDLVDKIGFLIVEAGEEVLCGKLVSYSDDLEMTILARCSSSGMNSSSKPYYNPLIDFLKINRMMRKQMKDMPDEFGPLFLEADYKSIDILAIYI